MRKLMLAVAVTFTLAGCSDPKTAIRALTGAGYTHIQTTGWSMFGCAESDTFATGFKAKGPNGQSVSGVVCNGVFKGATIRTD